MALLSSILQQQKPPEWDEHTYTNKRFVRITLEESSQEYEEIKTGFIQKYGNRGIAKIERVQHPFAFARFKIRGEQLAKKNGSMPAETREFFEIDNPAVIETILEFNCDPRRGGFSYSGFNLFSSRASGLRSDAGFVIVVKTFAAFGFDERDTHRYPEYLIEFDGDKADQSTGFINQHPLDNTLPLLTSNNLTRMEEVSVVPPESDSNDMIACGTACIPVFESSGLTQNSSYRITNADVEVISLNVSPAKKLRMSSTTEPPDELLLLTDSAITPSSEPISTNCGSPLFEKSTNNSDLENPAASDDTLTSPTYSPSSPSYNPSCDTPFSSRHTFTATSSSNVSPEYSPTSPDYSSSSVSPSYSPTSPSSAAASSEYSPTSPHNTYMTLSSYSFTSNNYYSRLSPTYSLCYSTSPISTKNGPLSPDEPSVFPIKNQTLLNNGETSLSQKGLSSIVASSATSPVYSPTSPSSYSRSPSYNTSISSINSSPTCLSYSPTSPSSNYNSASSVSNQTSPIPSNTLLPYIKLTSSVKSNTSDGNQEPDYNNFISTHTRNVCQLALEKSLHSPPYSPSCSLNVSFSPGNNVGLPSNGSTSSLDNLSSPSYNSTSVTNDGLPLSVSDLEDFVSLKNNPSKCEPASPNYSPSSPSTCSVSPDSKTVSPHYSCSSLVFEPSTSSLSSRSISPNSMVTSLPYTFTLTNNPPSNYDSISPTYSPTSPSSCTSSLKNNSIVYCDLTSPPYSVTSPIDDIPSPDCEAISPAYSQNTASNCSLLSGKTPSSPIFKLTNFNYHSTFLKKH